MPTQIIETETSEKETIDKIYKLLSKPKAQDIPNIMNIWFNSLDETKTHIVKNLSDPKPLSINDIAHHFKTSTQNILKHEEESSSILSDIVNQYENNPNYVQETLKSIANKKEQKKSKKKPKSQKKQRSSTKQHTERHINSQSSPSKQKPALKKFSYSKYFSMQAKRNSNDDSKSNEINDLIAKHYKIVKRIASHILLRLPPSIQLDDLIQDGLMGLIEAAKNYDSTKGTSFESYASIRINGVIIDSLRKDDWAPRSVHSKARTIKEATWEIEKVKMDKAKPHEIAEHMEISIEEYYGITNNDYISYVQDFNIAGTDINDEEFLSLALDPNSKNPIDLILESEFKSKLSETIDKLPEKEKLVISLYYNEYLNLREIGSVLGVSESRISQIMSQEILRCKSQLNTSNESDTQPYPSPRL